MLWPTATFAEDRITWLLPHEVGFGGGFGFVDTFTVTESLSVPPGPTQVTVNVLAVVKF